MEVEETHTLHEDIHLPSITDTQEIDHVAHSLDTTHTRITIQQPWHLLLLVH